MLNDDERRVIEAAIVLRAAHVRETRTAAGGIAGATDALFKALDGLGNESNDDSALTRLATDTFLYLDRLRNSRPCVICGDDVDTRENGTDGAQLRSGAWVCSDACWDAVNETADALDEANATIARLNHMLRRHGYGQGQIDAYAFECEARERAEAALESLVESHHDVSPFGIETCDYCGRRWDKCADDCLVRVAREALERGEARSGLKGAD